MTRKSKIARLPRSIRDELNHRLDNGHTGVRLVEWLNSLPEAKEILAREFQSHRITTQNLSEWKHGGYQDWLAQQEHAASLQDFLADAKELGQAASPEKLTEAIFTYATVHYAAAMYESAHRPEHQANLNRCSQMLNDVIRLRNCDLARERFDLDTQKLAFNAEKLEIQTQLANLRLDLDRQRLEPVRQKAGVTTVGQASCLSPTSSPASAAQGHIEANHPRFSSAVTSETPVNTANHPLGINTLQANPTKSKNTFFIFSQTAKPISAPNRKSKIENQKPGLIGLLPHVSTVQPLRQSV